MILGSNPRGVKDYSVFQNGQSGSGGLPASYSIGTGDLLLDIKGLGHETDC
jgi:hypothetical protein